MAIGSLRLRVSIYRKKSLPESKSLKSFFELAVSDQILAEIKATLQKPYLHEKLFIHEGEEDGIINLIRERAFVVTRDRYKTDRLKTDPDDNKFLACALETKADFIVSGDNHLLELKHYQGIQLVTAKIFVNKLKTLFSKI